MKLRFKQTLLLILALFTVGTLFAQSYSVGTRSQSFVDPNRGNRSIGCDVYYPATGSGNNAPLAEGVFPYVVFGHGFLMATSAYLPIAQAMASSGIVVFLPTTESGFSPNHTAFARDLAFVGINAYEQSNNNSAFFFYEALSERYAVGGHSMGGGCTYLSVQYQTSHPATCLFTFAAAETNPSAVSQMAGIAMPNLLLGGALDCVTPPANHQIPMYNAQNQNACRYLVLITGGYHCQFNASNFTCSLGENSCIPPGGISREAQIELTLSLTLPWLKGWLEPDCAALGQFGGLIEEEQGFEVEYSCILPQLDQPLIAYQGPLTRCEGDWITLEAVPGIGDITWSTGETTTQITPQVSGTYTYTITNGQCALSADEIVLEYIPAIQAVIIVDVPPVLCPGDLIVMEAFPSTGSILWNTGASGPIITVSQSGDYWFVLQEGPCSFLSDTVSLAYPDPVFPEISPTGSIVLCPGDSILVQASPQIGNITWSNGWHDFSQWVNESGEFSFELEVDGCIYSSEELYVFSQDSLELEVLIVGIGTICNGASVSLRSNISNGNILWSNGQSGSAISVFTPGSYSYSLEVSNCIFFSDTLFVPAVTNPNLAIGFERDSLCPGDSLLLTALVNGGKVLWSDGEQGYENYVILGGSYSFTLDSIGCIYRSDTLVIREIEALQFQILPADSISFCAGTQVLIQQPDNKLVEWSTGEFSSFITNEASGEFFYFVDTLGCRYKSNVLRTELISAPVFRIERGYEEPLCAPDSIASIFVRLEDGFVLWSDGDTSAHQFFTINGNYSFDLLYKGCIFDGDSVLIYFNGTWILDTLSILGEEQIFVDSLYTYRVEVFDPNVIYAWDVVSGGANLLGPLDANSVQLRADGLSSDTIVLRCRLRDSICRSESFVLKRLILERSNTTLDIPENLNLRILYDSDSWVIISGGEKRMERIQLTHISGKRMHALIDEGSTVRIRHQGWPSGLYVMEVRWESGLISKAYRLIKW